MRAKTVLTIEPMGSGMTRIVCSSYAPGTRQPLGQITLELDRGGVREFVADLCQKAGLPTPW